MNMNRTIQTSVRAPRLILSVVLAAAGLARAAPAPLRAPAVPLVAHDPYFSIWSPADRLTDADTMHWTGKPHRLTSLVRIDGRAYRLLGASPTNSPALPQTGVEILPTRTIATFEGAGVNITLRFMSPALPADLEALARPVTYVTWTVRSADAREHEVQLYFDASAEIAVHTPEQVCTWDELTAAPGLRALRVGTERQPVLQRKGDDVRIDWGHLLLAAPGSSALGQPAVAPPGTLAAAFAAQGLKFINNVMTPSKMPANALTLSALYDVGRVGDAPVSRHILLAYDDISSIRYFGENLRPYWRRNGDGPAELLAKAEADYASLGERCAEFDAALLADLERVGGAKYAALCALAYRQTTAGNKIAADANGQPLMFPKENFSNGCIGTVDVLFPQAPFFLALSPALTRAMLAPILDYASSPLWPYDYAPHDLGTYPWATGQVYGMKGGDGGRMPVEESGNMLIMLAALARIEGGAGFAEPHMPMLKRWADYLVARGLDPENQLCSADMFGHLPHCANLALKAVLGIGAYAQLCERAGDTKGAAQYMAIARDYAAQWREKAKDDGRTRLAYHLPGTWGMKHNLVWDRVLGLGLFPQEIADAEVAWYLTTQNRYGLPVDNRTDTSLIDWAMWSIAPARERRDFEALVEPIFRYANETADRVPLSDWYITTTARRKGFQARPVVGGLFIRLLTDAPEWAAKAARVTGSRAPLSVPRTLAEVVPTARKAPIMWRYTLEEPSPGWERPGADDSAWKEGPGGFGTAGTPGAIVRTEWKTKCIRLRRSFALGERLPDHPQLIVHFDEDAEVYLNGTLAATLEGWSSDYEPRDIRPEALAALHPGTNLLAVLCRQSWGGQYIDVGIGEREPSASPAPVKTSPAAKPGPPPGLRKLMDEPLRDPSICRGPDGTYYLTGTSEPFWSFNNTNGIRVWKSKDLTAWDALGTVWRYGGSPWHAKYLTAKKPLWAPEIHYLKGTFWLTYSIPGWDGTGKTSGCGLLKSTSGKAEGPYEDVQPGERLGDEIDASLFEDDDGTVYFLWHSGKIARMKPDMTGLAEPYRWLRSTVPDPDPKHHAGLCAGIFGKGSYDHVGFEGMFMLKEGGRYLLCASDSFEGRYSCACASSTNLFGPYSARYEAIPHGGHGAFFRDADGRLWSTYFGPPWNQRAAILPMTVDRDGRLAPAAKEAP